MTTVAFPSKDGSKVWHSLWARSLPRVDLAHKGHWIVRNESDTDHDALWQRLCEHIERGELRNAVASHKMLNGVFTIMVLVEDIRDEDRVSKTLRVLRDIGVTQSLLCKNKPTGGQQLVVYRSERDLEFSRDDGRFVFHSWMSTTNTVMFDECVYFRSLPPHAGLDDTRGSKRKRVQDIKEMLAAVNAESISSAAVGAAESSAVPVETAHDDVDVGAAERNMLLEDVSSVTGATEAASARRRELITIALHDAGYRDLTDMDVSSIQSVLVSATRPFIYTRASKWFFKKNGKIEEIRLGACIALARFFAQSFEDSPKLERAVKMLFVDTFALLF